MDDEDGEGSNVTDSWPEPSLQPDYSKKNVNNDSTDGKTARISIFKGYKKRIFTQTLDNSAPERIASPEPCSMSPRDRNSDPKCGKITEYAQYLGLQPAGKYKCPKCNPPVSFRTLSLLKQHQCVCPGASAPGPSKPSAPSTNNFRKNWKVCLCSACGTYFENWNLFLHMREVHKRHICLFCLGMFAQAERLSDHLAQKHSVPESDFNSIDDFYAVFRGSCYLMCCTCEKVFSETDNFVNHQCGDEPEKVVAPEICSVCRHTGGSHSPTCGTNELQRDTTPPRETPPRETPPRETPPRETPPRETPPRDTPPREKIPVSDREPTLLPNPANAVAKRLIGAARARLKPREEDLLASYQRKISDLYARKINQRRRLSGVDHVAARRDSTSEEVTRARQTFDVSRSPVRQRGSERYVEQIHEDSDLDEDSPSEEIDRLSSSVGSPGPMEQGELILDDGTDESQHESLPSQSPVRLPTSPAPVPRQPTPEVNLNASNSTVGEEEVVPEEEEEEEEEEVAEEEEADEEVQRPSTESPSVSVSRVNSSHRSLVIKICTNKNSQFSVATPNGDGVYPEDGAESEANVESEKEAEASDDSDSGKLAVASEPEHSDHEEAANVPSSSPAHEEMPGEDLSAAETKETAPEVEQAPEITPGVVERTPELQPLPELPMEVSAPLEPVPEADGVILASENVPAVDLTVSDTLESIEVTDLLRQCIDVASPTCVYCNHARHIAVEGRQLALHVLAEHRFQPQHPAIIIQSEQFTLRVRKALDELAGRFFNFDSYDSTRGTYFVPEKRTYECFLCRIYYNVHKELYLHNRKMHQKTILICIMCKSTFYSHSELLCHLCPGVYAANVDIRYRCCICTVDSLPSAFRLMVHLRKRHNMCDVCLETTTNQQKLSNHVWKHKLHHLCYRCGIAYRNKPDITKHLFWKHGTESVMCKKCLQKKWPHVYHFCIPPTAFVCEECGSTFSRAVALKVHKRLHLDDHPYGCGECEERFISRKCLARHEQSHRPAPPQPLEPSKSENTSFEASAEMPKGLSEVEASGVEAAGNTAVAPVPKEPVRKVVDVYDLPPLNLSSESDSDVEDERPATNAAAKTEQTREDVVEDVVVPADAVLDVAPEPSEEEKKQEVVIMNGIWDNFKSYTASLETGEAPKADETIETMEELLKIILADHDYCVVYPDETEKKSEAVEAVSAAEQPARVEERPQTPPPATNGDGLGSGGGGSSEPRKKSKSPKKKKSAPDASSSSSDSSSDSDSSSCSCGSNCSCSTSSSDSSSSSSSSSDSDSSASEPGSPSKKGTKKQFRKERENRRKEKTMVEETAEPAAQMEIAAENGIAESDINVDTHINVTDVSDKTLPEPPRESDLETDETETDEDFYDEFPQLHASKILAEKKNQQILLASIVPPSTEDSAFGSSSNDMRNGAIETSELTNLMEVPQAVVPTKPATKRKIKTKRRKKGETRGRKATLQPVVDPIKLNIPKFLYRNKSGRSSPAQSPKLPAITYQVTNNRIPQVPASVSDEAADNKRSSKRKRVPKRFYGDSSDEEQRGLSLTSTPKWRRLDSHSPGVPYIPTITIKQNYGPPPPVAAPQVLYQPPPPPSPSPPPPPPPVVEPEPAPAVSASDSEDAMDTSSDSSVSEAEVEPPPPARPLHPGPQISEGVGPPTNRPPNLYCYCQCPYDEVSEMIACDGDSCRIEWFHFECVGIMVPPKGKWYCPDCRKRDSSLQNSDCHD